MTEDLELFNELVDILINEEHTNPVAQPIDTENLFSALDLELPKEPTINAEFKTTLTQIIKTTPKTASTSFFNQLFGGRMNRAVLGDLLAALEGTSAAPSTGY